MATWQADVPRIGRVSPTKAVRIRVRWGLVSVLFALLAFWGSLIWFGLHLLHGA